MEQWDIYDSERRLTGRTMKKNDWILQDGEYHLTVLGVVRNTDGTLSDYQTRADEGLGCRLVGGSRRCGAGGRKLTRGCEPRGVGGNRSGCFCLHRRTGADLSPRKSGRG